MHVINNTITQKYYNNNQPYNVYAVECSQASYRAFRKFIYELGFKAWHIHNGWVSGTMDRRNYADEDVLYDPNIRITWIDEQTHFRCPDAQDCMVIIKKSPDINESISFTMYCYDVVEKDDTFGECIKLKLFDKKTVIFNHNKLKFEIYKHINIFKKIKNYIKWIT